MAPREILVINVNWIGDVIFSTPFLRAARDAYPESRIVCLVHPRCKDVLAGNPCVDEIVIYDEEGVHRPLLGKLDLIAALRKRKFDLGFVLHRSFTKAWILWAAGVKERVGYATKKRAFLLTRAFPEPKPEVHKVEYFLGLARGVGIRPKRIAYEFAFSKADETSVERLLAANEVGHGKPLVVLCPGGNWDPKRWPRESFAALADRLSVTPGAAIVISGAKKDIPLAGQIRALMRHPAVITCGETSLKELGALFSKADLVVANDTGPMHVAVASGAKVIALFGPTSPELTGPYGEGEYRIIRSSTDCAVPCYDARCTDNRCMAAIGVDEVYAAALDLLKKGKAA